MPPWPSPLLAFLSCPPRSANLRSGRPRHQEHRSPWAPLARSYAGLPELAPAWVAADAGDLTLLDVRSREEFQGPDGHAPGSLPIPLPELEARASEIPGGKPVELLKAGRSQMANLRGGLSRWADEGYPLGGVPTA